jgi:iron complex transport system ATP-binding protein
MTTTTVPHIIHIKNATVYRGPHCVFDNFSLAIPQGDNTAILGPNGAGKSTLLKLLLRELYPVFQEESFIRIFGQDTWNVWDLRAHFGIVSHELQQHYLGSVRGRNVILSGYDSSIDTGFHRRFNAREQEQAEQLMDMLGIPHLQDRLFAEMSTGEQRRFLLGRALINDPDTLILDEPTSGLDIRACFQYLALIRRLMHTGKVVILVTHHIHEIPPEITHVILLKNGTVLAEGDKTTMLTDAHLTTLFETPVKLVHANGFYQAIPGE